MYQSYNAPSYWEWVVGVKREKEEKDLIQAVIIAKGLKPYLFVNVSVLKGSFTEAELNNLSNIKKALYLQHVNIDWLS